MKDHAWQQPVGFFTIPDAGLTSVAKILSSAWPHLLLLLQSRHLWAPQLSYASVAKSAAYQAVSDPEQTAKKKISASLDAEQAMRLVNRAIKWQDSDCIPGVMIAKDGEPLTQEILQKLIVKLAEPIRYKSLSKFQQSLEMSEMQSL